MFVQDNRYNQEGERGVMTVRRVGRQGGSDQRHVTVIVKWLYAHHLTEVLLELQIFQRDFWRAARPRWRRRGRTTFSAVLTKAGSPSSLNKQLPDLSRVFQISTPSILGNVIVAAGIWKMTKRLSKLRQASVVKRRHASRSFRRAEKEEVVYKEAHCRAVWVLWFENVGISLYSYDTYYSPLHM